MSIIDTLITDRTQADVTKLRSLLSKPKVMWTNEEWSEFLLAKDKGAYNATDLNRVQEAMEYLAERFRGYGYNVPEIKRPSITEVIPGTSRLPEGYTELEFIQSTGEQFVDTGISVPHATARIIVDFAPTSVAGDHKSITGHANTAFSWTTNFLFINGEKSTITLNGVDTGIVASVGTRYVVDYNQASYSINGGDHVSTTRSFTDGYNDTIFYSSGKYGEFKLYSYQLYNGSTLIRDLAPCKNPDGEVGLYDTITGEFFGNAGAGAFLAGEELGSSDGNTPTQIIERDYWEIGDIPRKEQMDLYLGNLAILRSTNAVLSSTPEIPEDMNGLTYSEANDIEQILIDIDYILTVIYRNRFYATEVFSGEV